MTRQQIEALVLQQIITLSQRVAPPIDPTPRLVDLGIDSLRLMELTGDLERALAVPRLPIEDWLDQEAARGEDGFRVASLVSLCAETVLGVAAAPTNTGRSR